MTKIKPPCNNCKQRRLEICRKCNKWKLYAIIRNQLYKENYKQNSVERSNIEAYGRNYKKAIKFKKGDLK